MRNGAYLILQTKSKTIKKSRRKENSKSWYNDSCLSLKKRLLNQARLLKKNPNDSYIRGVFMVCKKNYRKCLKDSRSRFQVEKLNELQSFFSEPKKFWKKLKESLGKSKSNIGNQVPPDVWVNHFAKLNMNDPEQKVGNTARCQFIESKLKDLEEARNIPCPILDKEFSLEEILVGIKALKKGKACGIDAISNDTLHCVALYQSIKGVSWMILIIIVVSHLIVVFPSYLLYF